MRVDILSVESTQTNTASDVAARTPRQVQLTAQHSAVHFDQFRWLIYLQGCRVFKYLTLSIKEKYWKTEKVDLFVFTLYMIYRVL